MLRIDREKRGFLPLETPSLAEAAITERYDLQEFISNSPEVFFRELGLELLLVGTEIEPSKNVQDRIDLLAIDREGACVVIELKRGSRKFQMLQAITYAGMIAQWSAADLIGLLDEAGQERLTDFLEVAPEEINRSQRIVLIAEAFDYALLVGAEWLSDRYGVQISCCRVSIAREPSTGVEYLVCSNVYPVPELADQAVSRGRRSAVVTDAPWSDWETALAEVENPALAQFFREQLAAGRESYLRKRYLHFRIDGRRRFSVRAARAHAYVRQYGRFDGDLDWWRQRLSDPESIRPVRRGSALSFSLKSLGDFQALQNAATRELHAVAWSAADEAWDETGDGMVSSS
ncbi:MAG TPA: hypothetical protein DCQ98_03770 [Planctomycetaceae bacterium]|nr:hypothetical protein [Planctomycetaceae bacterium]HRF00345.1 hypothetical protein [Pirellulaceae bacterium]